MKKWIAGVGAISLIFMLCSCMKNTTPTTETPETEQGTIAATEPSDTETEIPEPTKTVPTEEPATPKADGVTVYITPAEESEKAADSTNIYSFRSQIITLNIPAYPEAEKKISSVLNDSIADAKEAAEIAKESALRDYDESSSSWSEYFSAIAYTPQRLDSAVVSFSGSTTEFLGGTHPNTTMFSHTFDGKTGDPLTITDILTGEAQLVKVKELVLQDLGKRDNLFEGYEETVAERFLSFNIASAYWYLTDDALVYYFSPYEIAPYAEGTIEVAISYDDLEGILKDEYCKSMPEDVAAPKADIVSQEITPDFQQLYQVVLDPEGEHIYLHGFEDQTSIRISSGYWGISDNEFHCENVYFAASSLNSSDAIEIATFIPDAMPNIQIELNGTTVFYLSQSGEDGTILLLDNP